MNGKHYENIKNLIIAYNKGELTHDELVEKTKPDLDAINQKIADIAKKHGKRPVKIALPYMMRNLY